MSLGNVDRRRVTAGLAAAATLPLFSGLTAAPVAAQKTRGTWSALADLAEEAQRLGLSVPRMGLTASSASEEFSEVQPAIIDFMDSVSISAPDARGVTSAEVDALIDQASELLRTARNAERVPRDVPEAGAQPITPPSLTAIADEYRNLFATCKVRDDKRTDAMWYASKISDPARRKQYEQVAEETCVPWYFVGVLHGMEASFDTTSHLHNGDSLKKKTWQVPKGRPDPWLPPSDWVSSAVDAMKYDKLNEKADWDLASMLYRMEAYNGWRSRLLHNINTPYLWSFSNHYTKGKFVADNVWDGNAVSKQCGGAVMLKLLIETGAVGQPA